MKFWCNSEIYDDFGEYIELLNDFIFIEVVLEWLGYLCFPKLLTFLGCCY